MMVALIAVSIFLMLSPSAFAAQQEGMLGSIFGMFGNLNELYDNPSKNYSTLIDMAVYLVIFIGLAQATIGKKFEGKGGKAMVAGIGIVFAVGLALWEKTAGFNLKSFGPVAMIILIAIMCFACYEGLRSFKLKKAHAMIISYVVFYLALLGVGITASMQERFSLISSILALIFLACIIASIVIAISYFTGKKTSSPDSGGDSHAGEEFERELEDEKKDLNKEKEKIEEEKKKEEDQKMSAEKGKIISLINEILDIIQKLEHDIKVHDHYNKQRADIDEKVKAGKMSFNQHTMSQIDIGDKYEKEQIHFKLRQLDIIAKEVRKYLDLAMADAKSAFEKEEFAKTAAIINSLDQRLIKIEKWCGV